MFLSKKDSNTLWITPVTFELNSNGLAMMIVSLRVSKILHKTLTTGLNKRRV